VLLVAAVATATVVYAFGPLRVAHSVTGHPPEARFVGDYTAGCTIGPRACGALWDTDNPR